MGSCLNWGSLLGVLFIRVPYYIGDLKRDPKKFRELPICILHYLKDPKLWELLYIRYCWHCRIYIINRL